MSLFALFIILMILFLILAAVLAALMMAGGQWAEIQSVNFRGALAGGLVIALAAVLLSYLRLALEGIMPGSARFTPQGVTLGTAWVPWIIEVVLLLAVVVVVSKAFLFAAWDQAAKVALVVAVPGAVAYLLVALVVRGAVVARFVAPAGAMAPAVVGAHTEVKCDNCGLPYDAAPPNPEAPPGGKSAASYTTLCRNCGQANAVDANAKIYPGDRVLVRKGAEPQRWQLVVFRNGEEPLDVRRVVGLPGERVALAGGDVFINDKRMAKPGGTAEDMWLPIHESGRVPAKALPLGVQLKPSRSSSHWTASASQWSCTNESANADDLVLIGTVSDRLGYNLRTSAEDPTAKLTGDVKMECEVDQFSGNGEISFQWEFRGFRVEGKVAANGDIQLQAAERAPDGSSSNAVNAKGKMEGSLSRNTNLVFAVRDGQAYLQEKGRTAATVAVGPQDLAGVRNWLQTQEGQTVQPCRLAIAVSSGSVTLSSIKVYKDIYYRSRDELPKSILKDSAKPTASPVPPNSLFLLGDNSRQARDSRFTGPIEATSAVGVPRWIYWPPSRWRTFP